MPFAAAASGQFDQQVQFAHAIEARVAVHRPVRIDADRCVPAQQAAEHDPGLQACQRRAEAEVDAFAEGEMRIRVTLDAELVRTIEPSLVVVGRHERRIDQLFGTDHLVRELDLSGRDPRCHRNGTPIAERFFDGGRNSGRIRPQRGLGGGVLVERQDRVAEQERRGDMSGDQQNRGKTDDLVVAQALAVDLGADKVGE